MPTINLTEAESRMLRWVISEANFGGVSWETAAKDLGYTSSKTARNKWYPVRDKVLDLDRGKQGNAKAATGSKRKDSPTSSPAPAAKKSKTTKGKKAAINSASTDEGEEDEGGNDDRKVKAEDEEDSDVDIFK